MADRFRRRRALQLAGADAGRARPSGRDARRRPERRRWLGLPRAGSERRRLDGMRAAVPRARWAAAGARAGVRLRVSPGTSSSESGGVATYREPGPIRRFMGVGRWMRFGGWCRPHTEVTATAGRALAALAPDATARSSRPPGGTSERGSAADGSWSSYWWTSPHYATLQAVGARVGAGRSRRGRRAAASGRFGARPRTAAGARRGPRPPHSRPRCRCPSSCARGRAGEPVERAISRLVALQHGDGGWPSHPIMRIPLPGDVDPDRRRRLVDLGRGIVVADQHRTFTSAACVAALARARDSDIDSPRREY